MSPKANTIGVTVDADEWRRMIAAQPRISNSEFHKAFRAIGGNFMREFTRRRLQGAPGIKVRRPTVRKVTRTAEPGAPAKRRGKLGSRSVAIPRKARAIGFRGTVGPVGRLEGKLLYLRSGWAGAVAHEVGDTIHGHPWLYIPIRNQAEAKRRGVASFSRRKSRRGKNKGQPLVAPKVIRVRSVVIRGRLGFERLWRAYAVRATDRLETALDRIAERIAAAGKRRELAADGGT